MRSFLALLGALVHVASGAGANPLDTWGFSSRTIALGGAGTALASDVDAAYYNPAASTRVRGVVLSAGLLVADDFLQALEKDADIPTHVHVQLGIAAAIPLGGVMKDRIFIALAVSLPHDGLYDVDLPDSSAVTFPFWEARNRRLVLTGSVAGRVTDWLSAAIGVTILPDVTGDVRIDLLDSGGQNDARIQVEYDFAPVAGILVTPLPWISFGLAYRGEHATDLTLPVAVDVLDGVAPVAATVEAPAYAEPHQVAFGVCVSPLPRLRLAADVTWHGYGTFRYASPTVTAYDTEGAVLQNSDVPVVEMDDVWVPRLGVEWQALDFLAVRGGYGFVPSPVPPQTGATNLLDAHRHVLSIGLGFELPGEWLGDALRSLAFDVHGQVSGLMSRDVAKTELIPENPGFPHVSVSGGTFSTGLTVRAGF